MTSGPVQPDRGGLFATTRWSVVVRTGRGADTALETLCQIYWHPLYVYARRRGCSPQDAEDMT
jgi:RNA polymerase sigma-70 factor (ECF subfamily)